MQRNAVRTMESEGELSVEIGHQKSVVYEIIIRIKCWFRLGLERKNGKLCCARQGIGTQRVLPADQLCHPPETRMQLIQGMEVMNRQHTQVRIG